MCGINNTTDLDNLMPETVIAVALRRAARPSPKRRVVRPPARSPRRKAAPRAEQATPSPLSKSRRRAAAFHMVVELHCYECADLGTGTLGKGTRKAAPAFGMIPGINLGHHYFDDACSKSRPDNLHPRLVRVDN
jgi:hypothetical protein